MSLVGQALVTVVRRCLYGRTWAEGRVAEQPLDPIDEMTRDGKGKPYIAVYSEQTKGDPGSAETQRGTRMVTMKIVVYSPPVVTITEDAVTYEFEDNAGLLLNLMGRQVENALHYGNEAWVKLFRGLLTGKKIDTTKTRFLLIETESAVRIPALELELMLETLPEPEFGRALYGEWLNFDTQLRALGPDGAKYADLLKMLIEQPSDMPAWSQAQMALNLSDAAYEAIGLAPLATDEDGEAVDVETVDSAPDIELVGPTVVP